MSPDRLWSQNILLSSQYQESFPGCKPTSFQCRGHQSVQPYLHFFVSIHGVQRATHTFTTTLFRNCSNHLQNVLSSLTSKTPSGIQNSSFLNKSTERISFILACVLHCPASKQLNNESHFKRVWPQTYMNECRQEVFGTLQVIFSRAAQIVTVYTDQILRSLP